MNILMLVLWLVGAFAIGLIVVINADDDACGCDDCPVCNKHKGDTQ